jgi:3-oxoadipate enol-lactonase
MERFQASDGLQLGYCIDDFTDPWRAPETLLLLHSAMGNAQRFYAWVPRLARRYRVCRLDLRGHGASEVPRDPTLTIERLTRDVAELMDHLGWKTTHVVGNSAGGYLAQRLALGAPERVRSLALFGSTPGLKQSQAAAWIPQIARKGLRPFLAETIADRFPLGKVDPGVVEFFLDQTERNDVAYIARFVTLMTTLDWMDELPRIACPTLIVAPGAETVGKGEVYEEMLKRLPNAMLLTYEGLPHNICDAVPDRCVDDVLAFLARHFGAGGGKQYLLH